VRGVTPYYTDDHVTLYHGDCLDVLATLPDESVDAVVTDPPYLIAFMGRGWDHSTGIAGQPDVWRQVLRVLKPGGHLLAFGAPRTYHRMAVAVEDAGFEVRDSLMWLFGSGFPKSMDIGKAIDKAAGAERTEYAGVKPGHEKFVGRDSVKSLRESGALSQGGGFSRPWMHDPEQVEASHHVLSPATAEAAEWDGWGTAMKPAHEPIILARKPLSGTVAANVLAWGVGGINVDGCRIGTTDELGRPQGTMPQPMDWGNTSPGESYVSEGNTKGRWPANVILDATAAAQLDQQSGESVSVASVRKRGGQSVGNGETLNTYRMNTDNEGGFTDSGGASRFFYTPKADRHERPRVEGVSHPTVKPVDLMAYLVRLITPRGSLVLDPFAGTGTTAEAATAEGCRTILIEREDAYLPLIMQRLQRPVEVTLL
jgi:hypothetical protein